MTLSVNRGPASQPVASPSAPAAEAQPTAAPAPAPRKAPDTFHAAGVSGAKVQDNQDWVDKLYSGGSELSGAASMLSAWASLGGNGKQMDPVGKQWLHEGQHGDKAFNQALQKHQGQPLGPQDRQSLQRLHETMKSDLATVDSKTPELVSQGKDNYTKSVHPKVLAHAPKDLDVAARQLLAEANASKHPVSYHYPDQGSWMVAQPGQTQADVRSSVERYHNPLRQQAAQATARLAELLKAH